MCVPQAASSKAALQKDQAKLDTKLKDGKIKSQIALDKAKEQQAKELSTEAKSALNKEKELTKVVEKNAAVSDGGLCTGVRDSDRVRQC